MYKKNATHQVMHHGNLSLHVNKNYKNKQDNF